MINFILPRFIDNFTINNCLATLAHTNPEYFCFSNIRFIYAEGAPSFFYWSEANYNNLNKASVMTKNELSDISEQAITKIMLDCANPLLTDSDCHDIAANAFISALNNGSNCALVSSPVAIEFFAKNYPDYYLMGSEYYYTLDPDKKYLDQLTAIRQWKMDDQEYYKDIPKSKIAVCVASACWFCNNNRYECWQKDCVNRLMFSEKTCFRACENGNMQLLTFEEIQRLIKQGYTQFYLDTRYVMPQDTEFFIGLYLDLFIKPEYQYIVHTLLSRSGKTI